MKAKVVLKQEVELVVEGKSKEEIEQWLSHTTPQQAMELTKAAGKSVFLDYTEEILITLPDDAKADYTIPYTAQGAALALDKLERRVIEDVKGNLISSEREQIKTLEDALGDSSSYALLDEFKKAKELIMEGNMEKQRSYRDTLLETAKQYDKEEYHKEADITREIAETLI